MPLAECMGSTIFYAHVPKTGGSSVEAYLSARFGELAWFDRGWEAHWEGGGCRRSGLRNSPQHLLAEDAARLFVRRPSWTFATVRNPVDRIVSEYRFQACTWKRRRLLARGGFSSWLRLVLAIARLEPTVFDNHLRPQSDFVPDGAEVFKLEDGLDALADRLDEVTGLSADGLRIGHALKSETRNPVYPSAQDVARIVREYAVDYERFGYVPPDRSSGHRDRFAFLREAAAVAMAPVCLKMWRRGRL